MVSTPSPHFIDNPVVKGREQHYATIVVVPALVLKSWRESLFSYEWLSPDGKVKPAADLPASEQPRRAEVEARLKAGGSLIMPVLGIGMMDNVEIGSGRAIFLTLAAQGYAAIPVHVPAGHVDEFNPYLFDTPQS